MINLEGLRQSAENYHKGTMAIVERLTGARIQDESICPIVVQRGRETMAFAFGNKSIPHDMDYMQPYIVIGAFSLEILMKYLHVLETGEGLRGHKLIELYCQLADETKKHMRAEVPQIASTGLHREVSKEINGQKIQFSWEPHKLISNSSIAFERWRYSFESQAEVTWFAGYNELRRAFKTRIATLEDEKGTEGLNNDQL